MAGSAAPVAVIAIDGPAGSGKSTLAARVAARFGIPWFSSGALYRGVSYMSAAGGADPVAAANGISWALEGGSLRADGVEITEHLHSEAVDALAPVHSATPTVRYAVNEILYDLVAGGPAVVEGRDIGTEVFPGAAIKIFLDATPIERARRRRAQRHGGRGSQELEAIERRDLQDRGKPVGALRRASGAVVVDSSGLTEQEVCDIVLAIVRRNAPQGVFSPVS